MDVNKAIGLNNTAQPNILEPRMGFGQFEIFLEDTRAGKNEMSGTIKRGVWGNSIKIRVKKREKKIFPVKFATQILAKIDRVYITLSGRAGTESGKDGVARQGPNGTAPASP